MGSKAIYVDEINADEDWLHAKEFGINAKNPDASLMSQHDFLELANKTFGLKNIELDITYRDFGKLTSRLGYKELFFQKTPHLHSYDKQPFHFLIQLIIMSKIQYIWVKKYIDENSSTKTIRADLKKLKSSTDTLRQQLINFTEHHQQVKIRQIIGAKNLKDQLKEPLNQLYRSRAQGVIEQKIKNYDGGDNSKLSWTNLTELDGQLSLLNDLLDETEEVFPSKGGAPYKFSRTWLILEAARFYQDWNITQLSARISTVDEKPSGPFVRFLQQYFDIIDGYKIENSGLGSEAAKVLTAIFAPRERIMHKKLGPDLPIDELLPILKILSSHR